MENTYSTQFETESSALVKLFEDGNFEEARNTADELVERGHLKPLICYELYTSFTRLTLTNIEKAREAARVFEKYNFQYWLPGGS